MRDRSRNCTDYVLSGGRSGSGALPRIQLADVDPGFLREVLGTSFLSSDRGETSFGAGMEVRVSGLPKDTKTKKSP